MWTAETVFNHQINIFQHQVKSSSYSALFCIYIVYIYICGGLVTKSCLTLVTPWTAACQAPLSIGLFSQEYWSGLSFPSPGNLPNRGIKPGSPALQAGSLPN